MARACYAIQMAKDRGVSPGPLLAGSVLRRSAGSVATGEFSPAIVQCVVRRRRLTPRNRSESTCYHADRRPICTLNNTRQYSVPSAACRLACSEPVEGDRIAWTEAAGRTGEVRTIEAVVATRTETPDGHEIALRTIRAFGPGAPEPGGSIQRTAEEATARGCYRAPWSDEARRERILDPPKEVQERTLTQRRGRSHGGGIGM